ncbi:peptidylprolyl isomerase [Deinococcus lacus]|uniref:peptidylprolyl isomerase n=1 Tax=Deinococcus lacus TaxID=392561 RepID=UPI0036D33F3E
MTSPVAGEWVRMAELSSAPVRAFAAAQQVTDPSKLYRAVLRTSRGPITVELYPAEAPQAVNNFVFLALNHFYDGTRFHRVVEGFVAQGATPFG